MSQPSRARTDSVTATHTWVDNDSDARNKYVTAFGRGLAVIRCFSRRNPSLTIADVARTTGMNRATARRLLHTLESEGYVGAHNGRYTLRPRVMELGYAYLSSVATDELLQTRLTELAEQFHEHCSAGVLDGQDVLLVARAETTYPRIMTVALTVGQRVPAHLTALGRVLLAQLSGPELDNYLRFAELRSQTTHTIVDRATLRKEINNVRRAGFCVTEHESDMGICAAAVPVCRPNKPVMAISVATHASRATAQSVTAEFVPALRRAAAEIQDAAQGRD